MAQAKLSERERVSVLMMRGCGDRARSYDQVRFRFNRTFRNGEGLSPVSKLTIERTVRRFMNHGSIKDLQRTGRTKCRQKYKRIILSFRFFNNEVNNFYTKETILKE